MNKKLVKELFIIALLSVVVIFILGILFYDYIPIDQKITSVKYVADENVVSTIDEIKSNSGEDITQDKNDSLLQSYTIDKDDLSGYASDNSYESGKVDPFAEDSESVDEKVTMHKVNGTTTNAQNGNVKNTVKNDIVKNVVNTVVNKNNTTNTAKTSNTTNTAVKNTVKNETAKNIIKNETVKNTVKNETAKNTVKNESSTGTFFEKPNSK